MKKKRYFRPTDLILFWRFFFSFFLFSTKDCSYVASFCQCLADKGNGESIVHFVLSPSLDRRRGMPTRAPVSVYSCPLQNAEQKPLLRINSMKNNTSFMKSVLHDCQVDHSHRNKRYCTAGQCLPLRRKFMVYSIIQLAQSIITKHLVTGQRKKAPNVSAFHWSPHGRMVSIGQHFVTTRVIHLPKRTETSLITESDRSRPNHRIGPGCAGRA